MTDLLATLLLLLGLLFTAVALLGWASRRWPVNEDALIAAVLTALPQTQCAQCGYPGCRPYAEAIIRDQVDETLCPPGGTATAAHLRTLLGRSVATPVVLALPNPQVAYIDESRCIGCYLCIPACPVDAIVGAAGFLHTVLPAECTGCELCIAPCPVDCISLRPLPAGPDT